MSYLSYRALNASPETLANAMRYHRNKIKIRVYNTNNVFASQPSILENQLPKELRLSNITPLRTDYIDGKVTVNNKVELLVDLAKETAEDARVIIDLALSIELIDISTHNILLAYIAKTHNSRA